MPRMVFHQLSPADWEVLFRWRNDSLVRAASLQSGELDWATHCHWCEALATQDVRSVYIACYNNHAVGSVRTDRTEHGYVLSWMLNPDFRGQGYGKKMVVEFVSNLSGVLGAFIKKDNRASIHIAQSIGMHLVSSNDGILYYEVDRTKELYT